MSNLLFTLLGTLVAPYASPRPVLVRQVVQLHHADFQQRLPPEQYS